MSLMHRSEMVLAQPWCERVSVVRIKNCTREQFDNMHEGEKYFQG